MGRDSWSLVFSVDTRHSFAIASDMQIECSEGNLGETIEMKLCMFGHAAVTTHNQPDMQNYN